MVVSGKHRNMSTPGSAGRLEATQWNGAQYANRDMIKPGPQPSGAMMFDYLRWGEVARGSPP